MSSILLKVFFPHDYNVFKQILNVNDSDVKSLNISPHPLILKLVWNVTFSTKKNISEVIFIPWSTFLTQTVSHISLVTDLWGPNQILHSGFVVKGSKLFIFLYICLFNHIIPRQDQFEDVIIQQWRAAYLTWNRETRVVKQGVKWHVQGWDIVITGLIH